MFYQTLYILECVCMLVLTVGLSLWCVRMGGGLYTVAQEAHLAIWTSQHPTFVIASPTLTILPNLSPRWATWATKMTCLAHQDELHGPSRWATWAIKMSCMGHQDELHGPPKWPRWITKMTCLAHQDYLHGPPILAAWVTKISCMGHLD